MRSFLHLSSAVVLAAGALALPSTPKRPAPPQAGTIVRIVETFDSPALADLPRTGAAWGGGALRAGLGGGSGRLGDLRVPAGAEVVLSTEFEDFAGLTDPAIFDPQNVIDGAATVAGGFFDFASVTVEPGGTLRFEGAAPARLHARGALNLQGTLDVAGGGAPDRESAEPYGGAGGLGGPAAADGGPGADQPDGTAFAGIPGGGFSNPSAMVDGEGGGGIPEPSALGASSFVGGGVGGLHHPAALPVDPTDILGVEWDIILICQTKMIGGSGGGGGYAFPGAGGKSGLLPGAGFPPTAPPVSAGGAGVAVTQAVRALLPHRGLLRGGSGGGGGGAHLAGSSTNGKVFSDCTKTTSGTAATILTYAPHSAAGGGGGGGAVEVVAGNEMVLAGRIDASGGGGGGKGATSTTSKATPGGGGSGGAIRLLARKLGFPVQPGLLDVSGGAGGFGVGAGLGGDGAPGFVRVETIHPEPDLAALGAVLSPDAATLAAQWGAAVGDVLSTGAWHVETHGPAALSGAQSCWRTVAGTTGYLAFEPDQPGVLGWDMTVRVTGFGPVSWRGPNPILPLSLEAAFGTDLFGAPLVVRFQGARSAGPIANPCAVELHGPGAGIVPGSLTPWVRHPAELNQVTADPLKQPDLIRFQVLFDRDKALAGVLESVLDLALLARPQ